MRDRRSGAMAAVATCLAALAAAGCDGVGERDLVDFYVTVHLQTGFKPEVVDRLDTVIQADVDLAFDETEGSDADGGISWYTSGEGLGNEFIVSLTGDYFRTTAAEVSEETWEIDIPFQGGAEPGTFGLWAAVYWEDQGGEEREVGYGTAAAFDLPRTAEQPVVVEVTCRDAFQYTCRTGCAAAVNPCDAREDCGSGTWDCVDGCCVEG